MKVDFSKLPLSNRALSERPMTFCEPSFINVLSSIIDLIMVETGDRGARERWQAAQLRNLLAHAAQRSAFWRQRIGAKTNAREVKLSSLPVLTRAEVRTQVESEGSLLVHPYPMRTTKHSTSGSSGTPVEFFASEMNVAYYIVRDLAQYFIEGRDLSLNTLKLKPAFVNNSAGFVVHRDDTWVRGGFESFIRGGKGKYIEYMNPNIPLLCKEMQCHPVGYLIAQPQLIEFMLSNIDPTFFSDVKTEKWICLAGSPDPSIRQKFSDANIPVSASYSSEEVGLIGIECPMIPDTYHICTSNVIVEVDINDGVKVNDNLLGRVLLTHLHSYATPFIRYDVGDLGFD